VASSSSEELFEAHVVSLGVLLKSKVVAVDIGVGADDQVCSEQQLRQQEPKALLQLVVANVLHVDPHMVQRDTNFYRDLGATWEDMRVIANEFGNYFGLEIEDGVVDHMITPRDIEDCSRRISAGF
jgi:hypothetical protein